MLDPDIYGQMIYLISIAGVASVLSRFGLPYSITVFSAKNKLDHANQANFLLLISTSVAALVLIFVDPILSLLCFGLSLFVTNQSNWLGLKKYKKIHD